MTRSHTLGGITTTRHARAIRPQVESLEGRQLLNAGDLDLSFGTGGYVLTSSKGPSPIDYARAVQLQPDGKILVSGQAGATGSFEVVRLTPSGAMDTTFGSGGRVYASAVANNDMALQQDGRIVLVGVLSSKKTGEVFLVARFLENGAADTGFGPNRNGSVTTSLGNFADRAHAVGIQPDNKIVVGGFTDTDDGLGGGWDSALVRYNPDGSLDSRFGQGGKVVTAWSGGEDLIKDLSIQPDGKIVVAGGFWIPAVVTHITWRGTTRTAASMTGRLTTRRPATVSVIAGSSLLPSTAPI